MEAENATGVGSSNADPAASNGLNMGNYGNSSEYRTYTFDNVPLADNYPFTLRYVSGEAPTAGIVVNNSNTVNTLNLPTTNSWSGNYAQKTLTVYLQAGTNTIRVQGYGNGTFRQDKACVGCTAGNCRIGVAEEELVKAPESTELTAYPNPTTGEVTVSFPLGIGQEARISVFAMSGIIVQEHLVAGKKRNPYPSA